MDGCEFVCCAGGATKGILYLGAIRALQALTHRYHSFTFDEFCRSRVRGFGGASIGALAALAMLLSVPYAQLFELMQPLLASVNSVVSNPDLGNALSRYGLDDGARLKQLVRDLLAVSGLARDATLATLERLTRCRFVCSATNLRTQQCVYLSGDTHPDMAVADAVYTSMAVPFLFVPTRIGDDLYVDGGLADNVPRCFDPTRTLFFRLYDHAVDRLSVRSLSEYSELVFRAANRTQHERDAELYRQHGARVVSLVVPDELDGGYSFVLHMPPQETSQRVFHGFCSVVRFLEPRVATTASRLVQLLATGTADRAAAAAPPPAARESGPAPARGGEDDQCTG